MVLFRPVGLKELILIRDADYKAFPPRLEIQPIFYPVLNEEYAVQIAYEWNTRDTASGFVGYVTRFEVDDDYVAKCERKIVGARMHEELWVPAEELDEFNSHIVGKIEVTQAFYSVDFIRSQATKVDDDEWLSMMNIYASLPWHHLESIEDQQSCALCQAHLSVHAEKTGKDWTHGYTRFEAGDHSTYLCPPCFDCISNTYHFSDSSETS